MFVQLQEIQESVRLSFLNRFLDFAGNVDNSLFALFLGALINFS